MSYCTYCQYYAAGKLHALVQRSNVVDCNGVPLHLDNAVVVNVVVLVCSANRFGVPLHFDKVIVVVVVLVRFKGLEELATYNE